MRYKIGDSIKWVDQDNVSHAIINDIKGLDYIYTIFLKNGGTYNHPGCDFGVLERVTVILTPLEQAML